jgi:hypothetical protein
MCAHVYRLTAAQADTSLMPEFGGQLLVGQAVGAACPQLSYLVAAELGPGLPLPTAPSQRRWYFRHRG